jgi:hypothetical protein
MSTTFLDYRDGGETGEQGFHEVASRLIYQGVPTNYSSTSLQVVQHGSGANMSVDISIGDAMLPISSTSYSYHGWTTAVQNVTIASASPSYARISTIVAYVNLSVVSPASPNNPGALVFAEIAGTPGASPTAPTNSTIQAALGAGVPWTPLSNVTVPVSATQIVSANIADTRIGWAVRADLWGGNLNTVGHNVPNVADDTVALLAAPQTFSNKTFDNTNTIITNGWQSTGVTPTYTSNNGNKEFVVGMPSNLTSTIAPGYKVLIPRTVVPSTQCIALTAASSMYGSNATGTGISFTSAFTAEAWIYLNSYQTYAGILTRDNGTTGWGFTISQYGQVEVFYRNSGAKIFDSTQSVPLKRWVHVAASVNASSGTASIYINAAAVPSTSSGTVTSVNQGTAAFQLGADNAGSFFDGYIYQPRLWSAALSQATIEANMGVPITTTTSNLIFGLTDGTFTDMSGNGNNLTPNGGASSTATGNPFNAIEYGFVTAITSSTMTIFTGTNCNIPNQTLGALQYSNNSSPFGFPNASTAWGVLALYRLGTTVSAGSGTWVNAMSAQLSIPTGAWRLEYTGSFACNSSNTIGYSNLSLTSANGTPVTPRMIAESYTSSGTHYLNHTASDGYTAASQAPIYLNVSANNASSTVGWDATFNGVIWIEAVSAYIT